jgi:hypothetical protein
MYVTTTVDGAEIEVEIKVVGSSRVQNIDGSMEMHVFIHPVIGGPRGPNGGEPIPIPEAA